MKNSRAEHGKLGEELTAYFLRKKGYKILHRNYRTPNAEIDIIAANEEFIVFVEVKTRELSSYVQAWEAVTKAQMDRIVYAAEDYINDTECELQPRFDIAAVTLKGSKPVKFDYFDNAF